MNKTKIQRRIPTDKQWFDYKSNKYASWLYCYICSNATYNKEKDLLYYSKQNYINDLYIIKQLLGVQDKRTINKYINKLIDNKYIYEKEDIYYFPNNKEFNSNYYLIDKELLYNLCITKSTLTVQLFIYLSNRMKYKKAKKNSNEYLFTLKELKGILGYSEKSQNAAIEKAIKEVLQTLKAENYIDYDNIYIDKEINGIYYKIPNYKLKYICAEIPKEIQEEKEKEKEFRF